MHALLLDLDGTLIAHALAWHTALGEVGLEVNCSTVHARACD